MKAYPLAFQEQMMKSSMKKLGLAAALSVAVFSAHAGEQVQAKTEPATTQTATASAHQGGLTRAQVLEDLKRYQREHANPSYAELVFLR
ncbi:hypothetical protein [Herbaspirillum seropedicae]|uniref:hypothetical protein n=1 Tax=Herbaspirillum seropedicae TaxID=964 RepID=UPI003FCE66BB